MESKLQVFCKDSDISVSSRFTVDDAPDEDFATLKPISEFYPDTDDPSTRYISAVEWYRSRCFAYGATSFTAIENILESAERNPSEPFELNLNRCGYTNLHIQIALDALLNHIRPQFLTALHLCRNRLMNSSLAQFLGNVLQELQTITYLSLSFNTLDDECVGVLSGALSNSGVRWFDAEHCQITDEAGSLFFTAIAYSDCIERVNLSWNHLGMASGKAIGKFLSTQRSLKELNLCGNHLHPEIQCVVPLLLGAIGNEVLEDLNLSWNGLGGEAFGRALLKAVLQTKLKRLTLEHNLLATEEMSLIVKMLRKNESLLELWLGGNGIEEETSIDLARAAGRHPSLTLLSFGRFHFVPQRTDKLCNFFRRKTPTKQFIYQGVLMANPPRPVDVQEALLERCRFLAMKPKKLKLKRDIGHLMLQFREKEDAILTRDVFSLAVKQFGAKFDRALIEALMDAFEVPKQCIDAGAMAAKYLTLHPTDPPLPKVTKGKARDKKRTAVK